MFKKYIYFVISIFIVTILVVLQTTLSNIFWLSSVDLPISLSLILKTYFSDLNGMNFGGQVPLVALVAAGYLIAYSVVELFLIWVDVKKPYAYAFAGGAALLAIVLLMPLAFYNLDLIAGARTAIGKSILVLCGILSGYYYGSKLEKME